MSNQPKWKIIANIGDVGYLDYGGFFIMIDQTGVYPPEAEVLEVDEYSIPDESKDTYTVHRFSLERCTYINGILSDNKFHPDHPVWFATPESEKATRPQDTTYLSDLSPYCDITEEKLIRLLCSPDPVERAQGYRKIIEYHGINNLDDYPIKLTRKEAAKRYKIKKKPGSKPEKSTKS